VNQKDARASREEYGASAEPDGIVVRRPLAGPGGRTDKPRGDDPQARPCAGMLTAGIAVARRSVAAISCRPIDAVATEPMGIGDAGQFAGSASATPIRNGAGVGIAIAVDRAGEKPYRSNAMGT